MARNGLLQIDGKWPNLALMHVGGWLRERGESADRITPLEQYGCDVVYAAKIFAGPLPCYVRGDAVRGGTGWEDWKDLPNLSEEEEHAYPAYDMFDCDDIAMGFLTRGCIRHCPFCVVWPKEGKIHHHSHLSEWWRGQSHIRLLDPNLTASPDILGYLGALEASHAVVDFSQGIDARLVTAEMVAAIRRVRRYKQLHTAWDRMEFEEPVLRGMRLLAAGMPKGSVMAYVLIGYETTPEEDLYRVKKLSEIGIDPFVMAYDKTDRYQRAFQRWCNHKAIYKTVAWDDYTSGTWPPTIPSNDKVVDY